MTNVNIINLKSRTDRNEHIRNQFLAHKEFKTTIVEAVRHEVGAVGLWLSIKKIVNQASCEQSENVIICEDDHQFTENYNYDLLCDCIERAKRNNADMLCGGVSWFEDAVQVSENLFWVSKFSGAQFIIIFQKFFKTILDIEFNQYDSADYKLSSLSHNVYFIYPFISVQKEFGYSDVTQRNDGTNRVEELFAVTESNVASISEIHAFYKSIAVHPNVGDIDYEGIKIPTYVINLPDDIKREEHILNQFHGRSEFDIILVNDTEMCDMSMVGLWKSIRKISQMAIDNDDDVIIICRDDHVFTKNYSKEFLLKNLLEANEQGCEYLSCGTSCFDVVIPVAGSRFWTKHCLSMQFIVLYRNFFEKILNTSFDETIIPDIKLSEITIHKMILHPFISVQHNFDHSDAARIDEQFSQITYEMFYASQRRLSCIANVVINHGLYGISDNQSLK